MPEKGVNRKNSTQKEQKAGGRHQQQEQNRIRKAWKRAEYKRDRRLNKNRKEQKKMVSEGTTE